MLELKNIYFTFNKNSNSAIEALHDVSLVFKEHQWTYIIGGNGSGKTTLLRVINQELIPERGELKLNSFSKNDILFVDQVTLVNLIPSMTVYENLIFGLREQGMRPNFNLYSRKEFRIRVIEVLKQFKIGLEKRLNEQIKFLSGGEQQIIVASRIMLSNPKILLMDEFTSSLDQKWAPFILQKLKNFVVQNNIMILAVTHDYNQIENIADRLILLKKGIVCKDIESTEKTLSRDYVLSVFYGNE